MLENAAQKLGESLGEKISESLSENVDKIIEKIGSPITPVPTIPLYIQAPVATEQILAVVAKVAGQATSPQSLNSGIVFLSLTTAGKSALGFRYAEDPIAKVFYSLGFIFSTAAAGASSSSVLNDVCSISKIGVFGETVGEACYRIGERARMLAVEQEKKRIPIRKPIFSRNTGSIPFILTSPNSQNNLIIYKVIVSNIIIIVMVYGYIKIIINFYKKARTFLLKKRSSKNLKLLNRSVTFRSAAFLFSSILLHKVKRSKPNCRKSGLFLF